MVSAVPRPDHVVIVMEENRSEAHIVGSPDAPYLTSLAAQNANFTSSFAETHPSEPNYLALFSGSTQGVTDDSCPLTFNTPNYGGQLLNSGATFVGYSETLPNAGFTGCTSGKYARKHSPWVNWPAIPAASNQPFASFPSDYSTLPDVSFVVPNLDHDMHDGTIAQGDAWLQSNLDGYVSWAKTHNSLLVVTWDEDDFSQNNQIATIMAGQRIVPGNYGETINHYNVLRTLEDAFGLSPLGASASAAPILDVWSAAGGGQPPTASFTSSCAGLVCSFDGSSSADPDGPVVGYAWVFGDGATGSGVTTSHSYAADGSFTVRLTVTDGDGLTGTVTHVVTPTAPAGQPFASDGFHRTVASGWGTAEVGGTWTVNSAANTSVVPGAGTARLAKAALVTAYLGGVAQTDTDVTTSFSSDKVATGNSIYLNVSGRRIDANNDYRSRVRIANTGAVYVQVARMIGLAETALSSEVAIPNITDAANQSITLRFQVVGTNPTTLRAKAWSSATTEPSAWQVTASDSTAALQNAGSIAVNDYLSGSATNAPVTIKHISIVARATATPANRDPVAAFTSSCTYLSCTLDASASADPDGTISAYRWAFGDSTTGTGVRPVHSYQAAGTYTVTLTVTDNGGATNSIVHNVVATAPPNQPPVPAFTWTCSELSCAFDGSSSTDSDGSVTNYNWSFGDGSSGTGPTPNHSFAAAGTHSVSLVTTDDGGASASISHPVTVSAAPPNQPPSASFTSACNALACAFDGGGSTDADGTVASYAWTFGDSATGVARTPSHTYPAAGTYRVTLTVTDNAGATDSVFHDVTVSAPAAGPFALDNFNRTSASGWGTAEAGGAWTVDGSATKYTVSPSAGGSMRMAAPGSLLGAYLRSVASSDTDLLVTFSADKTPNSNGVYLTVVVRGVNTTTEYRARLRITGNVTLRLSRAVCGTVTFLSNEITVPGLTFTPARPLPCGFRRSALNRPR